MDLVAKLAASLAWPVVVLVVLITLRAQLAGLLGDGLRRLKAGPVEVEWQEQIGEVRAAVAVEAITGGAAAAEPVTPAPEVEKLAEIAPAHPSLAVLGAYQLIERELRLLCRDRGFKALMSNQMVKDLHSAGVLTDVAAKAINGLRELRNIAAHGGSVTSENAVEFVAATSNLLELLAREQAVKSWLTDNRRGHHVHHRQPSRPE